MPELCQDPAPAPKQARRPEILVVVGVSGLPAEVFFQVLGGSLLDEGVFGVKFRLSNWSLLYSLHLIRFTGPINLRCLALGCLYSGLFGAIYWTVVCPFLLVLFSSYKS